MSETNEQIRERMMMGEANETEWRKRSFTSPSGSVDRFSRDEIMEGLRALYAEWCDLKAMADGCSDVRLPDYEAALDQLERNGLPSPLNK